MREIKFRGQNMINGEWIFGFYIHDRDNHCIIVEFVDCQYEFETLCVGEAIFEEFGWHFTNSITESSLSCYDSSEVKIIGNIYENKELLEVK